MLLHLLFLHECLQKGLREFWPRYSRGRNSRNIGSLLPSSLCLRASSLVLQAGGKVFFVARSRYYFMAGVIVLKNFLSAVLENNGRQSEDVFQNFCEGFPALQRYT